MRYYPNYWDIYYQLTNYNHNIIQDKLILLLDSVSINQTA